MVGTNDKNAVRTDLVCPKCGTRIVFDPHCGNDWHITIHDLVLMKFCPKCGVMTPLVDSPGNRGDPFFSKDNRFISNKQKERIAASVAGKFNLGMKEVKMIAKSLRDLHSEMIFLEEFAYRMNQRFDDMQLTRDTIVSVISE